jgi:hypothetical protein
LVCCSEVCEPFRDEIGEATTWKTKLNTDLLKFYAFLAQAMIYCRISTWSIDKFAKASMARW